MVKLKDTKHDLLLKDVLSDSVKIMMKRLRQLSDLSLSEYY